MVKARGSLSPRFSTLLVDGSKAQTDRSPASKLRNGMSWNNRTSRRCWERASRACQARAQVLKGQLRRVRCWGDAEVALAALARLEYELSQFARQEEVAVAQVRKRADRQRRGPLKRRQEIEAALERFCRGLWGRKGGMEFDLSQGQVARSRRLLFGRVGMRRSHAMKIRSEASALRSLAGTPAGRRFLRVQTEIDREGLRGFLFQQAKRARALRSPNGHGGTPMTRMLRRVGVRLEEREHWFYELDREALGNWG